MITVDIPAKGAVNGHVVLSLPSNSVTDVGATAIGAIGVSSILFERLHAKGTNILMHLGSQADIHILARQEEDGLDLAWEPKDLDPARMDEVQARIKDKAFMVGNDTGPKTQAAPQAPPSPPHQEPPAQAPASSDEEEFLSKHLTRVP